MFGLNIVEISSILMVIITALYTVGTFLLWRSTQQTTKILLHQIKTQLASNYSVSQHNVIDSHRALFLSIILNPVLLQTYSQGAGIDKELFTKNMIATFLINHCLAIFIDYENGIIDKANMESFTRDARDMFQQEFVKKRWVDVKGYHPDFFRAFVESKLL